MSSISPSSSSHTSHLSTPASAACTAAPTADNTAAMASPSTQLPGACTTPAPTIPPSTVCRDNSKSNLLPRCQDVIPEEDPSRPVDTAAAEDGSDDVDDGVGDGIGSEDDGGSDDEDDDVNDNCTNAGDREQAPISKNKDRHHRKPLPSWLMDPFKAHVEASRAKNRDQQGLPLLYSANKSFYFPQPSTFFSFGHHQLSPSLLFNPRFFLWDPMAICRRIPCPNCRMPLQRHNVLPRPCRVVDFDDSIWLIGYCYRCRFCMHPTSGKNTVTFRSWDSRILNVLPPYLAAEFPARLTHRSGITKRLFSFMRSCFTSGMGAKQFSDAVRVQHLLRYDSLHQQYLHVLLERQLDKWTGRRYPAFPPFDSPDAEGPRSFVPSAQWLSDVYDSFIEEHQHDFNQHMALLPADVCAIDHSHKVSYYLFLFT
jgi:hypothetical protein